MVHDQLIHIHRLKQMHSVELQKARHNELESTNDGSSSSPIIQVDPPHPGSETYQSPEELSKTTETSHNSSNNNDKKSSKRTRSARRRLSWRNLLNPSYKSRSDSFYKIFSNTIPDHERLIADYSCALHREILIQGRLYISVNYLAFYSNIFSWVTKLVIHLRDVVDIRKTNTALFIPNAIQLVCSDGEKHVFASFVARDKSYLMISKLWKNNMMKELTNDEMRDLVHINYGLDLGMSDNDELTINSPDPLLPETTHSNLDTPPVERPRSKSHSLSIESNHRSDCNNNRSGQNNHNLELDRLRNHWLSSPTLPLRSSLFSHSSPSAIQQLNLDNEVDKLNHSFSSERFRRRSSYIDLGLQSGRVDQNEVIDEVVVKLSELHDFNKQLCASNLDEEVASFCNSSPVILDTPLSIRADSCSSPSLRPLSFRCPPSLGDESNEESISGLGWAESAGDISSKLIDESPVEKVQEDGKEEEEEEELQQHHSLVFTNQVGQVDISSQLPSNILPVHSKRTQKEEQQQQQQQMEFCSDCPEHSGKMVDDHVFEMGVDELFELLFQDPNFVRSYGETSGMSDYVAGPWLTTNSQELRKPQASASRILNYSMTINHILAKQVRVEEVQQLCRLNKGHFYQIKTKSVNSGIPYCEAFSIGVSYLLTKADNANKSHMIVKSLVKFVEDKASWRLSMVKPMIERQSMKGVQEFTGGLISYLELHIRNRRNSATNDSKSLPKFGASSTIAAVDDRPTCTAEQNQTKSRIKERKLRSMYRYYLRGRNSEASGPTRDTHTSEGSTGSLSSSFLGSSCLDSAASEEEPVEDRVSMLVNRERVEVDQVSVATLEPLRWEPGRDEAVV